VDFSDFEYTGNTENITFIVKGPYFKVTAIKDILSFADDDSIIITVTLYTGK